MRVRVGIDAALAARFVAVSCEERDMRAFAADEKTDWYNWSSVKPRIVLFSVLCGECGRMLLHPFYVREFYIE